MLGSWHREPLERDPALPKLEINAYGGQDGRFERQRVLQASPASLKNLTLKPSSSGVGGKLVVNYRSFDQTRKPAERSR